MYLRTYITDSTVTISLNDICYQVMYMCNKLNICMIIRAGRYQKKGRRYGIVIKYHGITKYHGIVIITILSHQCIKITLKSQYRCGKMVPTSKTFIK